jgi:hypothetical protein
MGVIASLYAVLFADGTTLLALTLASTDAEYTVCCFHNMMLLALLLSHCWRSCFAAVTVDTAAEREQVTSEYQLQLLLLLSALLMYRQQQHLLW